MAACGRNNNAQAIALYEDSIRIMAMEQTRIVDAPIPDDPILLGRRRARLQIIDLKCSYYRRQIDELKK